MPLFPVDSGIFAAVKNRVQIGRELDKMKLSVRKTEVEKSWWKKAAEEADLILSGSDGDDDDAENAKSRQSAAQKAKVAQKQAELDALLATPLTAMGFSGKYPTKMGRLEVPEEFEKKSSKSAIEALQKDAETTRDILKGAKPKKNRFKAQKNRKKKKAGAAAKS